MTLRLSGGRRLQSPPGSTARPTPARVRQAVMNILAADLPGSRWLDLFCGSGVMGCEALQRGASNVLAVDQDRRMTATARANLEAVAAGHSAPMNVRVLQQEVVSWLQAGRQKAHQDAFALIYADPPYASGLYGAVAQAIAMGGWLEPGGLLVLECATAQRPALPAGWLLHKEKRYGTSSVLVLCEEHIATGSAKTNPG